MSAQHRLYFASAEAYQEAMELAAQLETKGFMRRARRVRLNLDGPQPAPMPVEVEVEVEREDEGDSEAQRLIKQVQMSHQRIGDAIGVAKQTVTKWGAGGQIGPDKLERLKAFVEANQEQK